MNFKVRPNAENLPWAAQPPRLESASYGDADLGLSLDPLQQQPFPTQASQKPAGAAWHLYPHAIRVSSVQGLAC